MYIDASGYGKEEYILKISNFDKKISPKKHAWKETSGWKVCGFEKNDELFLVSFFREGK